MSATSLKLFDLTGKTAVVTGASRGIGAALAQGLAGAGARVVAVGRSHTPEKPFTGPIEYVSADVTVDAQAIMSRAASGYGDLNCLVNCAAVTLGAGSSGSEADRFRRTLETNLIAAHDLCLAIVPYMKRGGSIVNVTSIGSVMGFPGNPGYVSSKGGLRMLTKALAVDLGPAGIRVNALAPGYIGTAMTAESRASPIENERRRVHTCLGRWGEPEDLVGAAIFLASDASAYVTGADIFVDGGWTAKGLV